MTWRTAIGHVVGGVHKWLRDSYANMMQLPIFRTMRKFEDRDSIKSRVNVSLEGGATSGRMGRNMRMVGCARVIGWGKCLVRGFGGELMSSRHCDVVMRRWKMLSS